MLLGEPPRTQFDWNFELFGIPIRVCAWFWLAAFLLCGSATSYPIGPDRTPAGGQGMLIFTMAMFLSILIHELGHSFAFRRYGLDSHIVLYHFGGLAIPDRNRYGGYAAVEPNPWNDIFISIAGPAAQLLGALVAIVLMKATGHGLRFAPSNWLSFLEAGQPLPSHYLDLFLYLFLAVSIFWALMNLLPIYPLDGGQIARNLFLIYGDGNAIQYSLMLSIATATIAAIYGFAYERFMGIMFTLLAYSSYNAYRAYNPGNYDSGWQ
ncbi:MAG: site-2 protease family protein [Planctomycetota bacterium]